MTKNKNNIWENDCDEDGDDEDDDNDDDDDNVQGCKGIIYNNYVSKSDVYSINKKYISNKLIGKTKTDVLASPNDVTSSSFGLH